MNIVYPYKHFNPAELIYSLKSLKNYKDAGEVFIIGDSPRNDITGFTLLEHEPATWAGSSRYHDVTSKIYQYAKTHTGDFLLMNDDMYIFGMSNYTPTNYYRGKLLDGLREGNMTSYKQDQVYMLNWLRRQGLPLLSYELHVPMVVNCEKAVETIELMAGTIQYGNILMFRTVYGNMHLTDAKQLNDVKNIADYYGKPLLSTDEQTFEHGEIGAYVRTILDGGKAKKPKPVPKPAKKKYTIDVIMPVYNDKELVERAIKSIPKSWNIIVCDDGSTDGTYALLKSLKGITLLRNKKNIGVGKTLNRLYGELKSDYHVILSSDDYFYPEIKDAAKALDGTDLVYFDMVNNNGKRWDMANMDMVKYSQSTKFIRNEFFKGIVTNGANYKEDVSVMKQIVAKNPTVKYTSILGKHYNHPRKGSLSWHGRRGNVKV